MKIKLMPLLLAACMLLSGCSSWMDGAYYFIEPHSEQGNQSEEGITQVSSYNELRNALAASVEGGLESLTVTAPGMTPDNLTANLKMAVQNTINNNPIGAYAVERITYEVGTTGGVPAGVITIVYNHNRSELRRIPQVKNMTEAKKLIYSALERVDSGIVLKVSSYNYTDFVQLVQDYAFENPDKVMELPQVSANVYPNIGVVRVVELNFTYQTSRDSLKKMVDYVQPMFSSAKLYVQGEEDQLLKYTRLYGFLVETTEYTVETSITPAYSLLRYGVGDSKAFATVYATMCKNAGLECLVVSGTKDGEPRFWNIICMDGVYYHVDLLESYWLGGYQTRSDAQMADYVWDYTTYPECGTTETVESAE